MNETKKKLLIIKKNASLNGGRCQHTDSKPAAQMVTIGGSGLTGVREDGLGQ